MKTPLLPPTPHSLTLVADDLPEKRGYLAELAKGAHPESEIIEATSAVEAQKIIDLLGEDQIDYGVIDYDLGDGNGGEVIRSLRRKNLLACIVLATARGGASFEEEASPDALANGANRALTLSKPDFEGELADSLMTAA
ncbi:MAG: hypothetical protein PHI23_03885 [Candidatus Peribacteraceae bacterium]|nr:hypothetical protein [Candidatus Peribacteraceae bacterium]